MRKILDNFGGCFVSILVLRDDKMLEFAGILSDVDSTFCYLDKEAAGHVDVAIPTSQIFLIELSENSIMDVETDSEDSAKKELMGLLGFDDDDDDKGTLQ